MASKRKAQPMTDRPEKPSDEPVQDIRFWVKAFGEEIERSAEAIASRGRGGQQVGYSSADFAHCPPSTFGRLRRWLREFEGALESELTARTAETDEQAAERELGAWLVAHPGWTWSQIRLHGDYEVCLRYGVEPVWGGWQSARAAAIRAALAKAGGGEGG